MENTVQSTQVKDYIIVWTAILGGTLLFINWVWQGYLALSPGKEKILQDASHSAYYINELMLLTSTCCLLYIILALRDAINVKGLVWYLGFYISILGMAMFALGTLGFTIYRFADSAAMPNVLGLFTGIGNLAMYFGGLLLGIALLKGTALLKFSGFLFILQTPIVIIYLFGIIPLNSLLAGVLIGGFYGLGWILVGFFLSKE